jgi:hypothetical protein
MSKKMESLTIEELLAEADKLIRRINAEFIDDLEEDQRLEIEKQAQKLKDMKAAARNSLQKNDAFEPGALAEGMHEAIQDIVKAFWELDKDLF